MGDPEGTGPFVGLTYGTALKLKTGYAPPLCEDCFLNNIFLV